MGEGEPPLIDYEAILLKLYTDKEGMRKLLDHGLKYENVACLNEDAAKTFKTAKEWFQKTGGTPIKWDWLEHEHEQYISAIQASVDELGDDPIDSSRLVDALHSKYLFTRFRERTEEANRDGTFSRELEFKESLDKAKSFTRDLMRITMNSTSERLLSPMSEGMPQFIESTLRSEKHESVSFGFRDTGSGTPDTIYTGLRAGEMAVYAAYLKVGKSHLLCKSVLRAAQEGKRVAFFALEPSEEACYATLTALAAELPMSHVEDRTIPPASDRSTERDRFEALVGEEVFSRIFLKHPVGKSDRTMEEMYWQAYDVGADLLVGDQLSHVAYLSGKKGAADWLDEGEKAHLARELSGEANMASIWAHQLNRGAKGKQKPGSGDLARSIMIAQGADFMFYLAEVDGSPDLRTLACREPRRGRKANWELTFAFDPMRIEITREVNL